MDLETRVGQLFFVGFEGTGDEPRLRSFLREMRPGGLIHFARNIETPAQVSALNAALEGALDPPPFLSVDQEGGRVSRLRALLPSLPAAAELVPGGDAAIRRYAAALGRALAALGFNADFAPVVDLSSPGASNLIGDRSFGEDEKLVARCASSFIDGLAEAGVASFLKHFPGLGATDVDSHIALPTCSRSAEELWRRDLHPFRACSEAAAGIMIAHVHCPALDPGPPIAASLSPTMIDGVLRRRMGYEGVSLTDDLEMGAVANRPPGELATLALAAGNDMIMFCNHPDRALEARQRVLEALRAGRLDAARTERSIGRVLEAKRRFGLFAGASRPEAPAWEAALAALREYSTA